MSKEFEKFQEIFDLLLVADKNIWRAVLEVEDCEIKQLEEFVQPLMKLRGHIHVEFMAPMYKKYPELSKTFRSDDDDKPEEDLA